MSNFVDLTTSLHNFCKVATAEREASHGWQHMDCVRMNSLKIWESEKRRYIGDDLYDIDHMTQLIIAVAQLHDVADHKYGKTNEQLESVRDALNKHFSAEDVALVQAIIDNLSYSKEAKQRKTGLRPIWEELGKEGRVVRDVCSDADKIEAIGLVGIQRCLQYSAEVHHKTGRPGDITAETLIAELVAHGHEKLFILLDEYVVTEAGKALARPSHDVMMAEASKLEQYLIHHMKQQQQQHGTEHGGEQLEEGVGSLDSFEGGKILLAVLAEQ